MSAHIPHAFGQPVGSGGVYRQCNRMAVHIGVHQGLSQGYPNDVVADSNGYLWISTNDGLNRYNGSGFRVFHHDMRDTLSVASNDIGKLKLDGAGRLWVTYPTGECDFFEPRTESFLHVPTHAVVHTPETKKRFGDPITDYKNGTIIQINNAFHLVHVVAAANGKGYAFEIQRLDSAYTRTVFPKCTNKEWAFAWFYSDGTLIVHKEDTTFVYTPQILVSGGLPTKIIGHLVERTRQNNGRTDIFVESEGDVVFKFNYSNQKFIPVYRIPEGWNHRGLYIDRQNRLWLQQPAGNILRVNLDSGTIDDIAVDWENVAAGIRGFIGAKMEDNDGNIYIRVNADGVIKLTSRSEIFHRYPDIIPRAGRHTNVPGDGKIFDERKFNHYVQVRNTPRFKIFQKLHPFPVQHAVYDKDGRFVDVLSVPGNKPCFQLVKIDMQTGAYSNAAPQINHGLAFHSNDKQGDLWVMLDDTGRMSFGRIISMDSLITYPIPARMTNYSCAFVSDWFQNSTDDVFWLATTDGIISFDPATGKSRHFVHNKQDSTSLSNNTVFSICPDPDDPEHYLWAGTKGEGLNKMNKQTGKCTHYTTTNGLFNNVIYGILPDKHKNLWLSTNYGLCLFNPRTAATRNFTIDDGLPHMEFNRYEVAHDTAGRLYFGGMNGWVGFDPEQFYQLNKPSTVVLSRIELQNILVEYNHNDANSKQANTLPMPIEYCRELVFGSDIRIFTIGFAAIDMGNAKKVHYKYMLEGFDENWVDAGSRGQATFTNINPGTYTFRVLACNSDNVWNTTPTELQITILPPWWATWWFRLALLCGVGGTIYALYNYRVNQLLKVERLRNTIALDLHDEIGSSLSSISLYAAVLKRTASNLSAECVALVDRMINNTSEIMENMNDIVWATREDMSSFETVINRMRDFAVEMTEVSEIQLNFSTTNNAEKLVLSMQQRKNVYMFFKEAVNNAVKHSGCAQLNVSIVRIPKKLAITVQDNGKGFAFYTNIPVEKTNGGNGLKNMKQRAMQVKAELIIYSEIGNGTSLKMILPLK